MRDTIFKINENKIIEICKDVDMDETLINETIELLNRFSQLFGDNTKLLDNLDKELIDQDALFEFLIPFFITSLNDKKEDYIFLEYKDICDIFFDAVNEEFPIEDLYKTCVKDTLTRQTTSLYLSEVIRNYIIENYDTVMSLNLDKKEVFEYFVKRIEGNWGSDFIRVTVDNKPTYNSVYNNLPSIIEKVIDHVYMGSSNNESCEKYRKIRAYLESRLGQLMIIEIIVSSVNNVVNHPEYKYKYIRTIPIEHMIDIIFVGIENEIEPFRDNLTEDIDNYKELVYEDFIYGNVIDYIYSRINEIKI